MLLLDNILWLRYHIANIPR